MKSFRELSVWQKSMDLPTEMPALAANFPEDEKFGGLTRQARRASVSFPPAVAEGFGRNSDGDFECFPSIAIGSGYIVRTQPEMALNIGILPSEMMIKLTDEPNAINWNAGRLKIKTETVWLLIPRAPHSALRTL